MKLVILAGGLGTRISEETIIKPKPMIEIGNKPIIWHIIKYYHFFGIREFIICCGYKGYVIKEYFSNYNLHNSDIIYKSDANEIQFINNNSEKLKITLIDTGDNTMTGGRLLRVKEHIKSNETFLLTYGDGLSNINIKKLISFHNSQKKIATLSAVFPPARFGALEIDGNLVVEFREKPRGDGALINGGFFVLEPEVFKYLKDDSTIFEREPLDSLAKQKKLNAFIHRDFWFAMDTMRDKEYLNELWSKDLAPWKIW
jgi:glucose-1-phosphate cytidylyltransferase